MTVAPTAVRPVGGFQLPFRGRWLTGVCATIVALAVLMALIGPFFVSDPTTSNLAQAYDGPSADHPLGVDSQGRDLLARLVVGARPALLAAGVVVLLSILLGALLSLLAAWHGGKVDTLISGACNVLFGFPGILLAIVAAAVFGAGLPAAIGALTIAYTPFLFRILRSGMLQERNREYIAASTVQGLPTRTILVRHLAPNVMPMVASQATLVFGYAMVDVATISFLGLGVQPPSPDWGSMVSQGKTGVLAGYPQESLLAGGCIVAVVVAVNILGELMAGRRA